MIQSAKLLRIAFRPDGIGSILSLDGFPRFPILEHAYGDASAGWAAKLPPGEYVCRLGTHQLAHSGAFLTYEVTGVPGHTGILFHKGNLESDSEGCLLLGMEWAVMNGRLAVANSTGAFAYFMRLADSAPTFPLQVVIAGA